MGLCVGPNNDSQGSNLGFHSISLKFGGIAKHSELEGGSRGRLLYLIQTTITR